MFFGRFLLFSILLYNTEARTFDDNGPTAGTYPAYILRSNSTALPVKNTDTSTNLTESYDGSRSFNNETWYYEPATGDDITNQSASDNKTLTIDYDNWSIDTPAEVSIATENETDTTASTRRPYYSYWGNGLENSTKYASTLTKDTETPYYSHWSNGLENSSNTSTLKKDSGITTSTTRTPYYSFWGNELDNSTNTSASSNTTTLTEDSETTASTTKTPYYSYWGNRIDYTSNKTALTEDSKTTANPTRTQYYSYWGNGLENSNNTTALTEDSESTTTTTTRRPYYSYWGNGLQNSRNTLTGDSKTTTTTRRPYYSYWGNGLKNSRQTTAPTKVSETTSTRRSYYLYRGNKSESETTAPKSYYNWYNRTTTDTVQQPANVTEIPKDDDAEYGYLTLENGILTVNFPEKINDTTNFFGEAIEKSTTARTPYNSYWGDIERDSETTTTRRPYNPYWDSRDFEITTSRRSHNPYWDSEPEYETTTTRRPYYRPYWGIKSEYTTTTTRRPYTVTVPNYWKTWTSRYLGDTEYNQTTTNFYNTTETTSTTARIIIDPIWPTSSGSPVEVTTNSSVNTNEARDYGTLADFLKKLAGTKILPSTGSKAPKSNITNIAIANENGNMFFYMNNYF